MYQIPINFLEPLVQNMSFSFPDISNSATEKFFPVLILACLVNILFMLLGRIININIEDMLGFYISFIAVIINAIIFCYLTKSTWSFLPSVYFIWFLVSPWSYFYTKTYQVLLEQDDGADGFGPEDKDWLSNVKSGFENSSKNIDI